MRLLFVLSCIALASCAEPSVIETVNMQVNHDHAYQNYAANDYRPMKQGEGGNCARFAATKQAELAKRGISSAILKCRLHDGQGHAYVFTQTGQVLDNRFDYPITLAQVGCQ